MNKKLIIGNWKLNHNLKEVTQWVEGMEIKLKNVKFGDYVDVVICPPYPYLLGMADLLDKTGIQVGAQDVSEFEEGTFTGEVSAVMLAEIVNYVLIGHSERRKHFHEDLKIMKKKTDKALSNKLIPVVCISDKVWEDGLPAPKYNEKFFLNQMKVILKGLSESEKKKIIFGYEPPSAISKQKHGHSDGNIQAANVNRVVKVVEKIKKVAPMSKVIYGGSVKGDNVMSYLSQELIDGVLPGSASLHAQDFAQMVINTAEGLSGLR